MALHFIKRNWSSKPPAGTPVRVDGHWATDGLIALVPFNEAGGANITNLLGNTGVAYGMSSSGSQFTSKGYTINEVTTTEYIDFGAILSGKVTTGLTVACLMTLNAVPTTNRSYWAAGNPLGTFAFACYSKSTGEFAYRVDSSVITSYYGSVIPTAGRTYMNVLRYDGANVSAFLNGVRDLADQAQTGNVDNTTQRVKIGYTGSTSVRTAGATYHLFAIWNRALTETEIRLLYENPWQLFQPRLDAVIIPSAGTTSIYSDSSYKFDINNIISSDLALKWDMLNIITSDSTLKWDMAGIVYSDFVSKFDILNQIASDLAIKFDITSTVTGDLILKFDINSTVSSDLHLLWDAVGTVYSDCIIRYGIDASGMTGYFFIQDPLNHHSKYNKHKNYKKRYKVV